MIVIILLFSAVLALAGCTEESPPVYDAGQYQLAGAELDGTELAVFDLYPNGGYLLLSGDGTGRLMLGRDLCDITWQQEQDGCSVQINELEASGIKDEDSLALSLESLGLTLFFREGEASVSTADSGSPPVQARSTRDQLLWEGDWSGRLWFEDPQGEWSDYEDRTLSVRAAVSLDADGNGILSLYSDYYSEELPMAAVDFSLEQYKVHCLSGYMMSYPVPDWGMEIALSSERRTDIEDTVIMHPDIYEYGHFYNADPPADRNAKTDVLRLSGSCHDLEGGFDYKIVLTRP